MHWDFLEKIPELLRLSWPDLAKMCMGAFFVAFFAWGWVRASRHAAKAKVEADKQRRLAEREKERADFYQQISQLKADHAEETMRLREQLAQTEREWEKTAGAQAALQQRLSALESFDGKLWEQDTHARPPKFAIAAERKTRFISIANLKGGVGKTTLCANVGVSLARRGHRVLLVDLDFQGSLTRLCKDSTDQLLDIIRKKKTAARLLDDKPLAVVDLVHRVGHPNLTGRTCDFIAADESLAEVETRAQARWLVTKTPDARFLFRQLFHSPEVLTLYDFVLFDCPPRLTTACVNAFGCSDFLLVPVLLEQGSVEALPRTLRWLQSLPHVAGRARLLGVVANRVDYYGGKAVSAQQTLYDYLPETVKRAGYQEEAVFRAMVKNQTALIAAASKEGRIAAGEDAGMALFEPVTIEIEKGVQQ
jgi:cellulose biosynthesis protein BcsQ